MNDRANTAGAALEYLARGWSVVALIAGEKRPSVGWQAYQHRRPSRREVTRWFEAQPDANLAIVTGVISSLLVLDIDPRHGGDRSLAELEREHGPLPPTPEVLTGGGGRHLYFTHPGGTVHNRVGVRPGIDLRGDGGLVVAPPSLHPSGLRYRWSAGRCPEDLSPPPLPAWLQGELSRQSAHPGHPLRHWRRLVAEGVGEGERNNTIASLTGHLLWHDVDPEVVMELMLCWNRTRCRPPLDDDEVARTVLSIIRLHEP